MTVALDDIPYNTAVVLRGDISKLLGSAQASARTASDAATSVAGSKLLAVQASAAAADSKLDAEAAAATAGQHAQTVATAAAVTQAMLDEAEASATAAAQSAAAVATALAALTTPEGLNALFAEAWATLPVDRPLTPGLPFRNGDTLSYS